MRDYLHTHFSQKLALRDIATVAGLHPVHLSRAFPQRFGMTLGERRSLDTVGAVPASGGS